MTKDIIKRNGSTYQIIDTKDEFGQIMISLVKDGNRIRSYLITITSELEGDHQKTTGESLVPGVIQAAIGDIEQGNFDQV